MDESKTNETPGAPRGGQKLDQKLDQKPEAGFRAASFQQAPAGTPAGGGESHPSIDVILDVPVTLSLEVGRAHMSVGNLLRLTQGSVVELDRNAGEPLDVLVNGALVARGEIVVVNDKFGIRLTDVVAPPARNV